MMGETARDKTATSAEDSQTSVSAAKAAGDTSLRALVPFIERAALVVIVEPDGKMATLAYRPCGEGFIQRVGHTVKVTYGHEPYRYIERLNLKLDAPEPLPADAAERGASGAPGEPRVGDAAGSGLAAATAAEPSLSHGQAQARSPLAAQPSPSAPVLTDPDEPAAKTGAGRPPVTQNDVRGGAEHG